MLLVNMVQSQVVLPTWVGTVTAISLVLIALSFVSIAAGALIAFKKSQEALKLMAHVLQGLDDDLIPAFRSIREMAEKGKDVVDVVKDEADAFARTSRGLRKRVRRGADRIEERLQDLDALYEVVHEELEEAALSMATLVRTVRTGGGLLHRVRRFLPGGRRRR
jgi:uncharacterized protein YoxC